MSQLFDEDSKVIPYTGLKLKNQEDLIFFESCDNMTKLNLVGITKGKGFAGTMKRYNFAGGPATHGQKDHARQQGSIGTQGQGRVIPGKKMPGRMGSDKHTVIARFLGIDKDLCMIKVKGCVPGSRNSEVLIYVPVKSDGEN